MERKLLIFSFILISLFFSSNISMGIHANSTIITQQDTEIVLGGLFPLSGFVANEGMEQKSAAEMAIKEINSDTSLLDGYNLILQVNDTNDNPIVGALAARQLITAGAIGLIGAASSLVSMSIASDPIQFNKVPQISYASKSPDLSDKTKYPFFLRVVPPNSVEGIAIANIVSDLGWRLVNTLVSDDEYGLSGIKAFSRAADSLLINIVNPQTFEAGTDDFKPQLQRIVDSKAKIVVLIANNEDTQTVFSQVDEIGVTSEQEFVWIGTETSTHEDVFGSNPSIQEAMQGMIGTRLNTERGTSFESFLDLWEDCYGLDESEYPGCGDRTPNTYAAFAYDAVYTFAYAIQALIDDGEDYTDNDLLLETLYETEFTGATGPVSFTENGDRLGVYDIVNFQGDEFVFVGTWDKLNGRQMIGTIYWNGDPTGNRTSIPMETVPTPGFELYLMIITLLVIIPVLKKRRN